MVEKARRPAIVLVNPEIPGNTGTIGRTCVALDIDLILIRPYGFVITDKSVRRAGLDYWKHVRLREYDSWDDFVETEAVSPEAVFLLEEFGETSVYDADWGAAPYMVFGRETKGLPPEIVERYPTRLVNLPMRSQHIRSLNLSNAATAVAYQALRGTLTRHNND